MTQTAGPEDVSLQGGARNTGGAEAAADDPESQYVAALKEYTQTHSEGSLYKASLLSHQFVRSELGPEDIIALHAGALELATQGMSFREQARVSTDALHFLLEVMIAYGINHRDYLELKVREQERLSEKEVERERSRAEEAERQAAQRAQMLQAVAHELRTPLAVVKGSLDMARRALSRGQMDNLEKMAQQATEAVARLTRMTNDLFEASRGEAAPRELAPLDLREVVGRAHAWAAAALQKELTLSLEGEDEALPVLGDGDGLASVIDNLLSNATRYTPDGGRVIVRCERQGEMGVVEVEDTGIGMSEETKERIFEEFYRGPEAYETDRRGLGLGLALVRQLVLAHRGRIEVESTLGKGSTFRVLLPLMKEGETQR